MITYHIWLPIPLYKLNGTYRKCYIFLFYSEYTHRYKKNTPVLPEDLGVTNGKCECSHLVVILLTHELVSNGYVLSDLPICYP